METVIYRLLDKKTDQNSFFLNADGKRDETRKLDFTNSYGIINPFYLVDSQGIRTYYRYIAGCSMYDPAEQDKQKIVANQQNSVVEFKAGADITLDKQIGGVLSKWLSIHPWNVSSPNHKPGVHEAVFETYDPKVQVLKEFNIATEEDKALETLIDLKRNSERMRSVASLFNETANLSSDEEIYLGLRSLARTQPGLFNNSIGSRENQILADILLSAKTNVIGKDVKGWFFEEDQSTILLTTTKVQKDAEAELVQFLMSKEGEVFYRQLVIKKQQKEIALNAPAGTVYEEQPELDIKGEITNPFAKEKLPKK